MTPAATQFQETRKRLQAAPRKWLVTGVAGFIGSHLLQELLGLDQTVIGMDNLATGHRSNLDAVRDAVTPEQWGRFALLEGDIRDRSVCEAGCQGVSIVLHQAALGSVPRSLSDPLASHDSNVTGFINMLVAARKCGVRRFVYASSSSVYGDEPTLPKTESRVGNCLSPYAATKAANELYAGVFSRAYGLRSIGLRYFNVFGPRQDPEGPYAAVIPKWITALVAGQTVFINGDGETSRDFCYVANAVQANLLAATTEDPAALDQVYNVAVHERTSLNDLFAALKARLVKKHPRVGDAVPVYRDFRSGDVRHSLADISKASRLLGYVPTHRLGDGLDAFLSDGS